MRRLSDKQSLVRHVLSVETFFEMSFLNFIEISGICRGKVKCIDPTGTISGRGGLPCRIDAEARRHGDRTGLDTPVVHADNDGYWISRIRANALNTPPGDVRSQGLNSRELTGA